MPSHVDRLVEELWKVLGLPLLNFAALIAVLWQSTYLLVRSDSAAGAAGAEDADGDVMSIVTAVARIFRFEFDLETLGQATDVFSQLGFYALLALVATIFIADQVVHGLAGVLNRFGDLLGRRLDVPHDIAAQPKVARAVALLPSRPEGMAFDDWTTVLHLGNLRDAPPGYASQCDGLDDRRDGHRRFADYCEAYVLLAALSAAHIGYEGEHLRLGWVVAAASVSMLLWRSSLQAAKAVETERVSLALLVARERLDRRAAAARGDEERRDGGKDDVAQRRESS